MFKNVLVVCVGNICRSPVVEGLLAHHAKENNLTTQISSAGIAAVLNSAAHPTSVELMSERGIDITKHRARQLTSSMLLEADLVIVMEEWHQKEIGRFSPSAYGKVHTLGKWSKFEVPDPIGKPRTTFEEVLGLMEKGIEDWKKRLWRMHV